MTGSLQLRRPATAAALIAVVILLAWYQLLWKSQGAALTKAHTQYAGASTALYQAEQRLGHLKHLAKTSDQLNALNQRLTAAVPDADQLDLFLLELNGMAGPAGVTIQTVSPGQPAVAKGSSVSSIPVTIGVTGGYFAVQSFLDELRTGGRLMIIDGLTESPSNNGSSTVVTATITGHLLSGLAA